jgi:hypothetical protein
VPFVDRLSFERGSLPDNLSRSLVDGVDHPLVTRPVVRRIAVAVEAALEGCILPAADRAGDKDAIAPHDRARVRQAWNRRPPEDVFSRCRVPFVGKVLAVGDSRRIESPERWPAALARRRLRQRDRTITTGANDLPLRNRGFLPFRQPRAVVKDHPPEHASVIDQPEQKVCAVEAKPITTRAAAVLNRGGRYRQFIFVRFPGTVECRPSLPLKREGAVG